MRPRRSKKREACILRHDASVPIFSIVVTSLIGSLSPSPVGDPNSDIVMDLYLLDCQLRAMRERVRFCARRGHIESFTSGVSV